MTCCWREVEETQICHINQFYSSTSFSLMFITFFRKETTCWRRQNSDQAKALSFHNHTFRQVSLTVHLTTQTSKRMLVSIQSGLDIFMANVCVCSKCLLKLFYVSLSLGEKWLVHNSRIKGTWNLIHMFYGSVPTWYRGGKCTQNGRERKFLMYSKTLEKSGGGWFLVYFTY